MKMISSAYMKMISSAYKTVLKFEAFTMSLIYIFLNSSLAQSAEELGRW